MSEATTKFQEWTNQYWQIQQSPKWSPEEREENTAKYAVFLQLMLPILEDLCVDAESVGIDSSPLIQVRGVFNRLVESPDLFDSAMDEVWAISQRIEAKERVPDADPWVPVRLDDLELNRKWVKDHADDPAKPWIRWLGRGKYEIRQSNMKDYLKRDRWEKFGI